MLAQQVKSWARVLSAPACSDWRNEITDLAELWFGASGWNISVPECLLYQANTACGGKPIYCVPGPEPLK